MRFEEVAFGGPFGIIEEKLILYGWSGCRLGSLSSRSLASALVCQRPFADSRFVDSLGIWSPLVVASLLWIP